MNRDTPYLVLEERKFIWRYEEILLIRAYHKQKKSVIEIGEIMNEDPDDIALVIIDQAQKGFIR